MTDLPEHPELPEFAHPPVGPDAGDFGLPSRWNRLLPGSPELGAGLVAAYGAPTRRYHDLRHLHGVLDAVATLAAEAAEPSLVELAGWFHDAVYDVHRQDNEEQSARLAESALPPAGLKSEQVAEVARLVRLTANHDPAEADNNGAVLCDADLSILASHPESYAAYVRAVRREYAHVSEGEWRVGRAAVLEQLLDLPALFRTTAGASWEITARNNLRTELASLASRAP
ncbi:MAG: hypothetical protein H0V49_07515 [Nocardioidaceae bacterium]|nr:hypothetical protein [Nocardioidaceae bacterium]